MLVDLPRDELAETRFSSARSRYRVLGDAQVRDLDLQAVRLCPFALAATASTSASPVRKSRVASWNRAPEPISPRELLVTDESSLALTSAARADAYGGKRPG